MPSKMVNDRKKLNRALRAALTVHEAEALEGLQERLGSFLEEGEDLAGLGTFHSVLTRFLASRLTDLVSADEAIYSDQLENRSPLRRRDEAVQALRQYLIATRGLARSAFGAEEADELLAIEGTLTEDPLLVHQHGMTTRDRLRDPEISTPPLRLTAVDFDREALAAGLDPLVEELGLALDEVEEDRKLVLSAQEAKNLAMEAHDEDARAVAGYLVFLYRLAGKLLMSERVKPVTRRRPQPEDVEALARSTREAASAAEEADVGDDPGGEELKLVTVPANANPPRAA